MAGPLSTICSRGLRRAIRTQVTPSVNYPRPKRVAKRCRRRETAKGTKARPRMASRRLETAVGTPNDGDRDRHTSLGLIFLNAAGRAARQNVLGTALSTSTRPPDFVAPAETNSTEWGIEANWPDYSRVAAATAPKQHDRGIELDKHEACPYLVDTIMQGREGNILPACRTRPTKEDSGALQPILAPVMGKNKNTSRYHTTPHHGRCQLCLLGRGQGPQYHDQAWVEDVL